jgi:hypothetical protein
VMFEVGEMKTQSKDPAWSTMPRVASSSCHAAASPKCTGANANVSAELSWCFKCTLCAAGCVQDAGRTHTGCARWDVCLWDSPFFLFLCTVMHLCSNILLLEAKIHSQLWVVNLNL